MKTDRLTFSLDHISGNDFAEVRYTFGDIEGDFAFTGVKGLTKEEMFVRAQMLIDTHMTHHNPKLRVTSVVEAAPAQAEYPPKNAEWLFVLFASRKSVNSELGDLQEMFAKDNEQFGIETATRFYWRRVIRSIVPSIVQKVKMMGLFGFAPSH